MPVPDAGLQQTGDGFATPWGGKAQRHTAADGDLPGRGHHNHVQIPQQLLGAYGAVGGIKGQQKEIVFQSAITLAALCILPSMSYMLLTFPIFSLSVRP